MLEQSGDHSRQSRLTHDPPFLPWLVLQKFICSMGLMKPTTLLGTLILLSTWSRIGATEAGTYSVQKAANSIEQRVAAARSDDG